MALSTMIVRALTAVLGTAAMAGCKAPPVPTRLASPIVDSSGPVAEGGNVYWAAEVRGSTGNERAIYELPIAGGAPRERARARGARAIAVHAGTVYANGPGETITIVAPGTTAARSVNIGHDAHRITADWGHVYFATRSGLVGRVPVHGGTVEILATGLGEPTAIRLHGEHVYVSLWDNPTAGIVQMPRSGGAKTVLGAGKISDLAVDASGVYWLAFREGVKRVGLGGGVVMTLAANEADARVIGLDSTHVYWALERGALRAMPKGGGAVSTLAGFSGLAQGIAVTPGRVLWTTWGIEKRPDVLLVLPGELLAISR